MRSYSPAWESRWIYFFFQLGCEGFNKSGGYAPPENLRWTNVKHKKEPVPIVSCWCMKYIFTFTIKINHSCWLNTETSHGSPVINRCAYPLGISAIHLKSWTAFFTGYLRAAEVGFAKPAQKRNDLFLGKITWYSRGCWKHIWTWHPLFSINIFIYIYIYTYIYICIYIYMCMLYRCIKKNIYDIVMGSLIEATWILKHLFISGCFNWMMNQFFTIGNAWKSSNIQF